MTSISRIAAAGCLLATVVCTAFAAELYKWVDDSGQVHYGDSPPAEARLKKITGNVSSFSSVSVEPLSQSSQVGKAAVAKSVVMYSTSWCGYCKKARRHFEANNIPFKERDIEKSEKAAKAFKKLGARGVPVILIDGRRMNGFDTATFDRIYYGKS